jgi:hypothetical protein
VRVALPQAISASCRSRAFPYAATIARHSRSGNSASGRICRTSGSGRRRDLLSHRCPCPASPRYLAARGSVTHECEIACRAANAAIWPSPLAQQHSSRPFRNDAPHQDRQAVIVSSHYGGAVAGTAHRFTPTTDKSATRFEPEGIVLASPHVFPFAARLYVGQRPSETGGRERCKSRAANLKSFVEQPPS